MTRRLLLALCTLAVAAAQDTWKGVERIVAVGDVHGGYAAFVDVLRAATLIDEKGNWTGGKTHLVQIGDVVDRGPDSRKVMDLLMALEKQAPKAGGYVHCLIGNHEAMNLYGDLRYVAPGEFAAFRGKWMTAHPPGWVEHRAQFGPQGRYGKWIRGHNAVIRINDTLFVHGGISPKYAAKSIRDINRGIAEELNDFSKLAEDGYVRDEQGVLWYRGIAQDDPALANHVQRLLKNFAARRVVIGHTPTGGEILSLYAGAVLAIDVGLADVYGAHRVALVIEGDRLSALTPDNQSPIP